MTDPFRDLEVGYDIPARPGMAEVEVQTPCLVLDLDALDRNLDRMAAAARAAGMRLRPHGKMHKSADVAKRQIARGAVGLCAQKVSEAEALVRGGIADVLVTNEVRGAKIDRLARLPLRGSRIGVCVDDPANVAELSAATLRHRTALDVYVEIDCGGARCGVADAGTAVALARAVAAAPGLLYAGLHAYQGAMQHIEAPEDRRRAADTAFARVREAIGALDVAGLAPGVVTGAGTGSWPFEAASGLYTELQCGSYAFMDADYARIRDTEGNRLDRTWEHALFVLTEVMSVPVPGRAVCDAGLKALATDSGLPLVAGRPDLTYSSASDEHGVIADPAGTLRPGDRLRLIPGHCDPTCNLHDWYVGLSGGRVECLWPVSARGKGF
ncbi:DSD1 family PLP-dependent enzyme [Albidovulum sp.]|jgi:3-hydroxy-D-aspartate aldolase|uniref:DSD1 family PLP-dependent enzyme n=1 Tax=Albidovulum sp. TaxID=1872424 RepID=UPI0039B9022F